MSTSNVFKLFSTRIKPRVEKPITNLKQAKKNPIVLDLLIGPRGRLCVYQPGLKDLHLEGETVYCELIPNKTVYYPFSPMVIEFDIQRDEKDFECTLNMEGADEEEIIDRCLNREEVDRVGLTEEQRLLFEDQLLNKKATFTMRFKNALTIVDIEDTKKSYYIGYPKNINRTFILRTYQDYLMFDLFSDLLKMGENGELYLDFDTSLNHFSKKVIQHFILFRDVVQLYDRLRSSPTLHEHLDETYLPKFAEASLCLAMLVVQPILPLAYQNGPPSDHMLLLALNRALTDIGYMRLWEDYDISPLFKAALCSWEEYTTNFISPIGLLDRKDFLPHLRKFLNDAIFLPLKPDLQKQLIKQPKPWKVLLDIGEKSGVLWWFTELRASIKNGGRYAIAGRIKQDEKQKRGKCVRVAGDWWEACIENGKRIVKRWRSGTDEAVTVSMTINERLKSYLPKLPSFGNKDFLYFVVGSKIIVWPNKDELQPDESWFIRLDDLISSKSTNKRNALLFSPEFNTAECYYRSFFHLSDHHMLARYIEYKPMDDTIHKIEDIVFCFRAKGSIFELKSKHTELVEWNRYYSQSTGPVTEFSFFSSSSLDFVLTYSISKPIFSLNYFSRSQNRIHRLLPWGGHLVKPGLLDTIDGFSMSYDDETNTLAAALFYRHGPNKFIAIPQAKLYRLKFDVTK